jgi:uncharacterized OsmC-like protein
MYAASIENRGDTRYHATTRHAAFVLDTAGQGANPVDALLASLCACVGHYVRDYLHDQGIAYGGFTVDAEATATADGKKLAGITLWIDLRDAELGDQKRAALLAFVERCKVHGTLREGCPIETRFGRAARPVTPVARAAVPS